MLVSYRRHFLCLQIADTLFTFYRMHLTKSKMIFGRIIWYEMCSSWFYLLQEYNDGSEVEIEKPSKDEYEIAKWIKNNVPTKKTKFVNHPVEYFTGMHNI